MRASYTKLTVGIPLCNCCCVSEKESTGRKKPRREKIDEFHSKMQIGQRDTPLLESWTMAKSSSRQVTYRQQVVSTFTFPLPKIAIKPGGFTTSVHGKREK